MIPRSPNREVGKANRTLTPLSYGADKSATGEGRGVGVPIGEEEAAAAAHPHTAHADGVTSAVAAGQEEKAQRS